MTHVKLGMDMRDLRRHVAFAALLLATVTLPIAGCSSSGTRDNASGDETEEVVLRPSANGQKPTKGQLKDGKRTGLWTEFHENGKKKMEGEYKEGEETGPWTFWYENGFKKAEGEYYKGRQVGDWTYYSEADEGKIIAEKPYPKVLNLDSNDAK